MSLPGLRAQAGDEMRIGQEAAVEHQVGVERHAVFEAEALERQHQPRALGGGRATIAWKICAQLVNGEVRRVDDLVRHRADLAPASAAPRSIASATGRSGASGCGRRVSLKRRSSAASLASRNTSIGSQVRRRLQPPPDRRKLANEPALAHVDDDGDLGLVGVLAQRQVGQHRNQRRRQVVDAVVAEILERADRVRLAGAGHAGDDQEVARDRASRAR